MSTKTDFNSLYASEKLKFDTLAYKETPLTTTGSLSFTSISSGLAYNSTTGENGLILLLQTLFASSNITASDFNAKAEGVDLTTTNTNVTSHLTDSTYQTATGTATAITITTATLVDGYAKTFIASANNAGAATTINTKPLYKPGGTIAPTLIAGKAYTVWYNVAGVCFFIKASATGTAVVANVLAGTTFSNDTDTDLIGTMPIKTSQAIAWTNPGATIAPQFTVPLGYWDGVAGGWIADGNLIAPNILTGVSIFGVTGTAVDGSMLAGDTVLGSFGRSTPTSVLTNTKSTNKATIIIKGTIRIKFTLRESSGANTAWGQVYKNGSPIGVLRSTNSTTNILYSEDFIANVNDYFEFYYYCNGGTMYIDTCDVCWTTKTFVTIA